AVRNTIGARHGFGRSTLPLNAASPLVVAGNGAVTRFTNTAAPPTIDWQLTTARNVGTGFAPVPVMISPVTFSDRSPFSSSLPLAVSMLHGAPAPETPRIAFAGPVYGATVPTIVLNLSTVEPGPLPAEACAISAAANATTTTAGIQNPLILPFLFLPGPLLGPFPSP